MTETLKPCPLCGGTDLKHYVTNARERNRGVIVCKRCGLRLEAYSDEEYKVAQVYQGDFKSAHEFTWEQARKAVADKWNRRAERACHPTHTRERWECDACGCVIRPGFMPEFAGVGVLRYCPSCGARVRDES